MVRYVRNYVRMVCHGGDHSKNVMLLYLKHVRNSTQPGSSGLRRAQPKVLQASGCGWCENRRNAECSLVITMYIIQTRLQYRQHANDLHAQIWSLLACSSGGSGGSDGFDLEREIMALFLRTMAPYLVINSPWLWCFSSNNALALQGHDVHGTVPRETTWHCQPTFVGDHAAEGWGPLHKSCVWNHDIITPHWSFWIIIEPHRICLWNLQVPSADIIFKHGMLMLTAQ